MSFLYTLFIWTVPFLGMLTVIVFFHEMGHFLMGRLFRVPIDAFSIGFGPELLHWTDRHGTRWRLALLPLGGYVKFHGDGDPASMTRADGGDTNLRGKTMQTQEVWKRALIVAAGPAVNFLLAIVLFAGLFTFYGRSVTTPTIEKVAAGSPAEVAGFKPGDTVTAIDGTPITTLEELRRLVESDDGPMSFVVRRDGSTTTLTATPRRETVQMMFGTVRTNLLGISVDAKANGRLVQYGPIQALEEGTVQTWQVVEGVGSFVKRLVMGRESTDQLSGPVGIAKVTAKAAQLGIGYIVEITALVSVSIGLLNLLPIPILDGGFLMFFAFEAIRGRALSERTMEIGFRIGLSLIATLSIFALYNDTIRPKAQPTTVEMQKK